MYRQAGRRRETLKDLPACFFDLTSAWRTPRPTEMSARTTAHYVYCIPVESPTSFRKEEHHSRTGYNYIFTSYALDKQTLPWSKTLSDRKISRWLVRPGFIFTSISFVWHWASGFKVWRDSSRRWINFSSDKDTGCIRERKVWKRQVKEWEICRVGPFRSHNFDIGLIARGFCFFVLISFCPSIFVVLFF